MQNEKTSQNYGFLVGVAMLGIRVFRGVKENARL